MYSSQQQHMLVSTDQDAYTNSGEKISENKNKIFKSVLGFLFVIISCPWCTDVKEVW